MAWACVFCNEPIDPNGRDTYRRITGWEHKAQAESRRGGSDIVLREPIEQFAHPHCVQLVRTGVNPNQRALV